ncbi:GNAT family N-acetyltransferase [Clostridium sp. BSD2780061688st1 E8]|nr:GNAT family N-acetyltransferase [Clostridium sp. BSD2780061688st1 E8]
MLDELVFQIEKNDGRVEQIVNVHMQTFQGFFLTFLGRGFLKQLYKGFIAYEHSNIITAENENSEVIGFLAYSHDMGGFYKWLIKKKVLFFAWYGLGALCRNPRCIVRLLRAFLKPAQSRRGEPYIEVASIGVLPECKNGGVGSQLLKVLEKSFDSERFAYIALETDAEGNEAANRFYQKNGFTLIREYETPEGRKMFEYRYFGE